MSRRDALPDWCIRTCTEIQVEAYVFAPASVAVLMPRGVQSQPRKTTYRSAEPAFVI